MCVCVSIIKHILIYLQAYELSTLTGTQVMLLVASETGHVYTFATRKLQPMITSEAGKQLIQTCLNSPDPPSGATTGDQRMSATGFEETELSYNIADEDSKVRQLIYSHGHHGHTAHHLGVGGGGVGVNVHQGGQSGQVQATGGVGHYGLDHQSGGGLMSQGGGYSSGGSGLVVGGGQVSPLSHAQGYPPHSVGGGGGPAHPSHHHVTHSVHSGHMTHAHVQR